MIDIKNIPMEYRPIPFWSWNEKLAPEELRRQVREMHAVGLGAFFMHARGGLQTEYLSGEWMECVEACLDEAGKLGMKGWLYDENGWPSGFGGGLVNGLGEAYQQKYLRFMSITVTPDYKDDDASHTIAFYDAATWKLLGRTLPAAFAGKAFRAYMEINPYYVDNMDAKVVAKFIRVTHQHYYETLPENLLAHLGGIFTDEPQLSRNGNLWSLVIEDEYRKAYGRELLNELPGLEFDEAPGAAGTRVRFWNLCAKLFRDNFLKQIREWCDAHNWKLTGHHVLEETCAWQTASNGSIMAQYQYYHIPGMDMLSRALPSSIAMTQLETAAAQFGHKQILTESFALTGWNCNFTGQRFVYHPQLAHGVNLLCQHLEGYSLRGLRKRDYPSSAFYHQPWWKDYKAINDYFSGIGYILANGTTKCRVLVVHPLSSVWTMYAGDENKPGLAYYTNELKNLTDALEALQIPLHYADEVICDDYSSFKNGRIVIGQCSYDQVIIPPVRNLSSRIISLIQQLQHAGGMVFRIRNTQDADILTVDGEVASAENLAWFQSIPVVENTAEAAAKAAEANTDRVRVMQADGKEAGEFLSTWREVDDLEGRAGRVYFITNTRYSDGLKTVVSLPKTGPQVEILDTRYGTDRLMESRVNGDRLEVEYYFGASDAILLFVPNSPLALRGASSARHFMTDAASEKLDSQAVLTAADENILTLDNCRYRVDGGEWQTCATISLQARLLQFERDCNVELEYPFMVSETFDVSTPLSILVETPWIFKFALNGVAFEPKTTDEYRFDKAFRRIELPANVQFGMNVIGMSLCYHQPASLYASLDAARKFETEYNKLTFETELESIYLMGQFAVRHTGAIENLAKDSFRYNGLFELAGCQVGKAIDCSNLEAEGYPFFAGNATIEKRVVLTAEQAAAFQALRFTPHGANTWRVAINGTEVAVCLWEPYIVSVAGLLKEGENSITFTLTTSLRNMLGPHHLKEGDCWAVCTTSFNREPNFTGRPAPDNVDGYCFVHHGLTDIEFI